MKMTRKWAMPSGNTFEIAPINRLILRYRPGAVDSIDPFANRNRLAKVTNDIDPEMGCDFALDALVFLKSRESNSADLVLFDPPYSPRQVAECYKAMGLTVNMETTQASFWSALKDEITRILRPGGHCISAAWNSNGIGITRGFQQVEILIVAHGGQHNDTIITVEQKQIYTLEL